MDKLKNFLKIREVDKEDLEEVLEWRNDIHTRKMFIEQNIISIDNHKIWFENNLSNPLVYMYLGYIENQKIGFCKFELDTFENSAEISINLNPKMRGKNLSYSFLKVAIKTFLGIKKIDLNAKIKKINKASLSIFDKCKFIVKDSDNDFFYLERKYF